MERKTQPLYLGQWRLRKMVACFSIVGLVVMLSFGTAFAISADMRQAVVSFFFPGYTQNQLQEIDEGHRTGSFSMEDTLFTFLEKFNREHMADDVMAKKENGFEYVILTLDENSINVIVKCTVPDKKLLVIMEQKDYQETEGLWQVTAYQILESETADEMIENGQ